MKRAQGPRKRSRPWCRLYADLVDDKSIGTLSDAEFRTLIELRCHAAKQFDNGRTGLTADVLDWALRRDVSVTLQKLQDRKLVAISDGGDVIMLAWDELQLKSDSSADRVAKSRESKDNKKRNVTGNGIGNVTVTLEEEEEDLNKSKSERARAGAGAQTREVPPGTEPDPELPAGVPPAPTEELAQLPPSVDPALWSAYRAQLEHDGKLSLSRVYLALGQIRSLVEKGVNVNEVLQSAPLRSHRDLNGVALDLEAEAKRRVGGGVGGGDGTGLSKTAQGMAYLEAVANGKLPTNPENQTAAAVVSSGDRGRIVDLDATAFRRVP